MDGLSEEDTQTVCRVGKAQVFLSQLFNLAEISTGVKGEHVAIEDIVQGFI